MTEYNFDMWKDLASNDPDAFEKRRKLEIEKMISNAAPDRQDRLRGLQWRVDMTRRKHSNPTVACQKVFNMMWESVYGEVGLQNALRFQVPLQPVTAEESDGQVLSFSSPNS